MATIFPTLATLKVTLVLAFMAIGVSSVRIGPAMKLTPTIDVSKTAMSLDEPVQAAVFQVLARGQVPPSGPSHRGHDAPVFKRHLLRTRSGYDQNFRMLRSSPSHGDGH